MMKIVISFISLFTLSCVLSGCGPKEPDTEVMQKQHESSKKSDER